MTVSLIVLSLGLGAPPATVGAPLSELAPRTAVVIALDAAPDLRALIDQASASARDGGARVLTASDLSARLRAAFPDCPRALAKTDGPTERACSRPPDETALASMAKEATSFEANFDGEAAIALRRKIIEVFDRTPRPSPQVRDLAAQAWQGIASAQFAAGHRDAAAAAARDGALHFGDTAVDPRKFSPQLQRLFTEAKAKVAADRATTVTVRTTEPGILLVDGNTVGPIAQELSIQLPVGRFRLWLQASDGTLSLPYPVESTGQPLAVTIDPLLDRRLVLGEVASLSCTDDECPSLLARLRVRLGVDEVTGVRRRAALEPAFCLVTASATPGWVTTLPRRTPATTVLPPSATSGPIPEPAPPPTWTRFRWALVTAAAALIAGGTGAAFGLRSKTSFDQAQDKSRAQLEHDALNQRGTDSARVANTLFAVSGATAILTGGLLWAAW